MLARNQFEELKELAQWIDVRTAGLSLPSDERSLLAAGYFDVAFEHHVSILHLHSSELYGSTLALLH